MKKSICILVTLLLLTGCSFGVVPTRQLNIVWRIVNGGDAVALDATKGGVSVTDKRYYGSVPRGSRDVIEIEADVSGDKSGEFDFRIASDNPSDKVANNKLHIIPTAAEKGSVLVSSQGLETLVDYEIFPSGVLFNKSYRNDLPTGFDFATGEMTPDKKSDIWLFQPDHFTMHAEVGAILDRDGYWGGFVEANNLHEYEYVETSFEPDFNKVYVVKCQIGYAAFVLDTSGWSFVYKYSETGIFE